MSSVKLGKGITITDKVWKTLKNRINMVGVELEGGWEKLPPKISSNAIQRDTSVHIDDPSGTVRIGELPSPPLDIKSWPDWVTRNYPQIVNASCGMHVHMSFKNAFTYSRTMDPRFPATIVAYMKEWADNEGLDKDHPLWPRLKGKSEYCQHVFDADSQIQKGSKEFDRTREGHRYTVINYAYGRYTTVECRLLPMMATPALAVKAIQGVLDITNAYLLVTAGREKKETGSVESQPNDEIREIRQVRI